MERLKRQQKNSAEIRPRGIAKRTRLNYAVAKDKESS